MARVTLQSLCKSFGEVHAIDNLSLDIADGSFVTLLGPSGCGKTTTLNCIAGLEEATSGSIWFDDVRINDLSPRERDVAMVFQDYALYPHMNVYENMAFGLKFHGVTRGDADRRVRSVAEALGLDLLLDRKPSELSGGQRQRVALGRAIVRNPVVYLMDEPLSNLDAALRVRTRTEIKRLHRDLGVTTIYVTHDQEEAMVLSDKIAIMRAGTLQQYATPHQIYNDPVNIYVAGFIGSPAMNFLPVKVSIADGLVVCVGDGFVAKLPARRIAGLNGAERAATLGVRPEGVLVSTDLTQGDFPAKIALVEPVGPVTYLDLQIGHQTIKASADSDVEFHPDDAVAVRFNPTKVFFFDPVTGQRL